MFLSKPITSTNEDDKLDSSYINNVNLLKLERTTVNVLEGNRSRIQFSSLECIDVYSHTMHLF